MMYFKTYTTVICVLLCAPVKFSLCAPQIVIHRGIVSHRWIPSMERDIKSCIFITFL